MLINNCHKSGMGSIEEIQRLIKKEGKEWVAQLLRFKVIDLEVNS
jgi:hypothetical protein